MPAHTPQILPRVLSRYSALSANKRAIKTGDDSAHIVAGPCGIGPDGRRLTVDSCHHAMLLAGFVGLSQPDLGHYRASRPGRFANLLKLSPFEPDARLSRRLLLRFGPCVARCLPLAQPISLRVEPQSAHRVTRCQNYSRSPPLSRFVIPSNLSMSFLILLIRHPGFGIYASIFRLRYSGFGIQTSGKR